MNTHSGINEKNKSILKWVEQLNENPSGSNVTFSDNVRVKVVILILTPYSNKLNYIEEIQKKSKTKTCPKEEFSCRR